MPPVGTAIGSSKTLPAGAEAIAKAGQARPFIHEVEM